MIPIFRCFGDMRTSGGPIVSLFYSLFPIGTAVIITVCYLGIWITIKVNLLPDKLLQALLPKRLYSLRSFTFRVILGHLVSI